MNVNFNEILLRNKSVFKGLSMVSQAKVKFFLNVFRTHQGANEPIPKRERNPKVSIVVFRVCRVMNLMLFGADKNPFKSSKTQRNMAVAKVAS